MFLLSDINEDTIKYLNDEIVGFVEIVDKIKFVISSYAMSRAGRGSAENFLNSLLVNLLFTGLSVFLSFSLIPSEDMG